MGWAVAIEGRYGPEAVLMVVEDRFEAESLATEIRLRGQAVVVRPYPERSRLPR
jgi:hypothetical protein